MLKIGSLNVADLKLGSTQVIKAYLGDTLVWEKYTPTPTPPTPAPTGYNTIFVVGSSSDTVTLTYGSETITSTGSASATVISGTDVIYTVTDGTNTATNTVNVHLDTTITIDLTVEKYDYNVLALSDQTTYERPALSFARVVYDGFNASYKITSTSGCHIYIPVGTTAKVILYSADMKLSTESTATKAVAISFGTRPAKLLTITRTPSDANIVVKDYYGYTIPAQSDSGGIATYYQPQYNNSTNAVTVVVSKDGYTTNTTTYTPTYQTEKTLTINL